MSSSPRLEVRGLAAAWGATPVLRGIDLEIGAGEYFVLLGPNGSGKTTLLRCLAGLERPRAGRVFLDGRDLTDLPPHRRGIGLMFQDPALFPHRTVYENVAYAPLLQRRPTSELAAEVGQLLDLLKLRGFEDRSPDALSGGERQRVALARTLAARPRVVLLDEPFASIDVELKAELRAEFRRVLTALGIAAVHVTHDREEGLFLGDRVGLLFDGVLDTVGRPVDVAQQPRTPRAARFLGYNVLRRGDRLEAVDPRDLRLSDREGDGVPLELEAVGSVGRETVAVLRDAHGRLAEARWEGTAGRLAVGQRVFGNWDAGVPVSEPS